MSEWISVKDEMPEPSVLVLVYEASFARTDAHDERYGGSTRPFGVRFGHYIESLDTFRPEGCNGEGYDITYWMPLPEPPK